MTEDEAIAYLHQFMDLEDPAQRRRGPGFTLDGMRCLLDLLEHPERAYPSVVVAGSKGKGSTSAMIASILAAAGYRTGLYTQPHLHHWRERVRMNGEPLPAEALIQIVERLRTVVPRLPERCPAIARPTAYELGTAVALLHFATARADVAVLEIGLGGRLDAVNTVTPVVSAITPISLEHTDVLGSTIEAIAGEKAGIIKPGVPVVIAPQPAEAAAVFVRVAAERKAPLIWATERTQVQLAGPLDGPLALQGQQPLSIGVPPGLATGSHTAAWRVDLPLLGAHQHENAATAVTVCEALAAAGLTIPPAAVATGLAQTRWPGRLEIMRTRPLVVVVGAHNPASAARLGEALATHFPGRRLTLILGTLGDKDLDGIVAALAPAATRILAVAPQQARATPVATIVSAVARAGRQADAAPSVAEALDQAVAAAGPDDLICVTGSLMIVAEARAATGYTSA
jgi:dihydrofolate synthase/folylpolyglutamate synthase